MPVNAVPDNTLLNQIAAIIEQSRGVVAHAVNQAMVSCYWQIVQRIVEHEQQLKQLSEALTARFGKGIDVTNLRNIRQFYLCFPIRNTLYRELSWSHYHRLLRINNEQARLWYMQEAVHQDIGQMDTYIRLYDEQYTGDDDNPNIGLKKVRPSCIIPCLANKSSYLPPNTYRIYPVKPNSSDNLNKNARTLRTSIPINLTDRDNYAQTY